MRERRRGWFTLLDYMGITLASVCGLLLILWFLMELSDELTP